MPVNLLQGEHQANQSVTGCCILKLKRCSAKEANMIRVWHTDTRPWPVCCVKWYALQGFSLSSSAVQGSCINAPCNHTLASLEVCKLLGKGSEEGLSSCCIHVYMYCAGCAGIGVSKANSNGAGGIPKGIRLLDESRRSRDHLPLRRHRERVAI